MTKKIFFISAYRDVTCKSSKNPDFLILNKLDSDDRFKVYSTANKVLDSSCFKSIDFLTLGYKGDIQIQKPGYNYAIYKAYNKVKNDVDIIHHCEKFQVGKAFNSIPLLSDITDKTFLIGPIEIPHAIFEDDFLAETKGFEKLSTKLVYHSRGALGKIFKVLFKKTIEKADKLIVCDAAVKRELSKYISPNKIEIINYGVDLSTYRGHEYDVGENNYNIVCITGAAERRGVEYLLRAIPLIKKHYPAVKLHMRTKGLKVEDYKKITKELGINENVVFHFERLDVDAYLNLISKSRLLCLPTLGDNYCYAVMDAMCLGVPVVTTNVCTKCASELFDDGDIGIIVDPKNSEQLADAILKLFNDFELCIQFSGNGLKKRGKFDTTKMVAKYIELYERYI